MFYTKRDSTVIIYVSQTNQQYFKETDFLVHLSSNKILHRERIICLVLISNSQLSELMLPWKLGQQKSKPAENHMVALKPVCQQLPWFW